MQSRDVKSIRRKSPLLHRLLKAQQGQRLGKQLPSSSMPRTIPGKRFCCRGQNSKRPDAEPAHERNLGRADQTEQVGERFYAESCRRPHSGVWLTMRVKVPRPQGGSKGKKVTCLLAPLAT